MAAEGRQVQLPSAQARCELYPVQEGRQAVGEQNSFSPYLEQSHDGVAKPTAQHPIMEVSGWGLSGLKVG